MSGLWVFVCGASGAGKDSVMAWAQKHLAGTSGIVFSRRMVTRPAHAGSDHDEVSAEQFTALAAPGGLAWHWQAHGFGYGISARYADDVAQGRVVVVNGSREHVMAQVLSPVMRVVQIVANPLDIANRLAQRARDTPQAVAQRLERNTQFADLQADCIICNDATVAEAGLQLANYLESCT
jgi:ribose 1,5-bisphosphokinase